VNRYEIIFVDNKEKLKFWQINAKTLDSLDEKIASKLHKLNLTEDNVRSIYEIGGNNELA